MMTALDHANIWPACIDSTCVKGIKTFCTYMHVHWHSEEGRHTLTLFHRMGFELAQLVNQALNQDC